MTELKTLKDIEHIEDATKLMRDEYKGQKSDLHLYRGQALRVEAIKWIKELRAEQYEFDTTNVPSLAEAFSNDKFEYAEIKDKQSAIDILKMFFVLSEEDLK